MQPTKSLPRWKQWLRPNRLIPLLTILGAGVAVVLSLVQVITINLAEGIIIALLALLAGDALSERINILEKIETKLGGLSVQHTLKKRIDIPSVEGQASYATEICIAAISAIPVITRHHGFFENKLRDGCDIRLILLNPNSHSLQTLNLISHGPVAKSSIESCLEHLDQFSKIENAKGKFELRLLDVFLPFSLFGVDLQKETGTMVVEFLAYREPWSERPHVFLTKKDNPYWFDFYRKQFDQAWSEANV